MTRKITSTATSWSTIAQYVTAIIDSCITDNITIMNDNIQMLC